MVKVKRSTFMFSCRTYPILTPPPPQHLLPVQLSLQWTLSHTRHVRFENYYNIVHFCGTNPHVSKSLGRGHILRCHVWIRTMIETEESPLGPFHMNPPASCQRFLDFPNRIHNVWLKHWYLSCKLDHPQ